ncbi:N-acetylglucosamine kinase [Phytoactinopolyspora limicola]|uniref:N-acetylglucosamine kinase n=1 Tax=Phytoactinopolyspora limicola TaxID=2715536 RepID=UPI00140A4997|nr:BadF/BadG/BcrA/BcrD ATPase family protein [Phytoactinopolyspora limicola]
MRIDNDGSAEPTVINLPGVGPGSAPAESLSTHLINHLTERLSPDAGLHSVAIGATGLHGRQLDLTTVFTRWSNAYGVHRLLVADDGTTAHLGALRGSDGVVLSAGTGSVALATGPGGSARVDGVGYLLGDDGSGYWIGRAGLAAALRHRDRRGPATELSRLATQRFGELDSLPRTVQDSSTPTADIARFCPDVAAAAHNADPVARAIWNEAGALLARTIVAGAAAVDAPADVQVSWVGALFDAGPILVEPLIGELRHALPHARVIPAAGTPLDGVTRLLHDEIPAEIAALVSTIEREDG